jgi:cell division protein FtsL
VSPFRGWGAIPDLKRYLLKETRFNSSLMYLAVFIIVILSAIALFLFQYMNQKRKIRLEEMHGRKRQQFEELLKLISDKDVAVSDTTNDEEKTES